MNNFFKGLFFVGKIAISLCLMVLFFNLVNVKISPVVNFFLSFFCYFIVDLVFEIWLLVSRVNIIVKEEYTKRLQR